MQYRSRRGNQVTVGRDWLEMDVQLLKKLAGRTKPKLIARILNRSYEATRQMAKRLNLSLKVR